MVMLLERNYSLNYYLKYVSRNKSPVEVESPQMF